MSPLKIFVSYSHQDEIFLNELEKHLATLKREKLIATWHDRKIVPGQEWEKEIEGALQDSDIYIFLISPDFIASEYCNEKEVSVALERHDNKDALVIPLVVRPADWLTTPLGKIQALPKDANPISLWGDRDQAWLAVVNGIRSAIGDLNLRRERVFGEPQFFNINEALISVVEQIETRYALEGNIGGLSTGLHELDRLVDGIHMGDLVYVASAPVMDRLALLVSIINHIVVEQSRAGLFFTLRQSKDQIARRLCSAIGRVPVHAMQRGELEDDDWSRLTHALGMLNDANIGIVECQTIDIDSLIAQIDKFCEKNDGCDLVLIDYLEHVTGGSKSKLLSILGRYSRKNKIPIVVADGLTSDPSSRVSKRPVLRDIGEWGVLNEDIDIILFVYQDEKYDPDSVDRGLVELIVAKNHRGDVGMVPAILNRGHGLENLKLVNT